MREAMRDSPELKRPVPPGIVSVRIDPDTGLLANPGQGNAIFEYFPEENVPGSMSNATGETTGSEGTGELVRDIF